ncbi:ATP-dependent zinc protease [Candidatus Woesearchaeota archaeon]|nr:ATP-dependent zinc protease [Candidatus Woesearchaeota archaeon]
MSPLKEPTIVGLTEEVTIFGKDKDGHPTKKTCMARIDTGATRSSLDEDVAKSISIYPSGFKAEVKSASGHTLRHVAKVKLLLHGREFIIDITLIAREHMKYKCLIGRDILKKGFLIDPSK